ncbi:MAG TPA: efflux transporter outer membrane subunit [Asticcacaulis sp.]|nr:efflux transporter outer membrane subunit [Asticcacaulis sp.]
MKFTASAAAFLMLGACTLAPRYEREAPPVAQSWPVQTPTSNAQLQSGSSSEAVAQLKWRSLFVDPALQKTIDLALSNNRDLRIAALDIERARAQYRISRADLLPSLDGGVSGSRSHTGSANTTTGLATTSESYSANVSAGWELDLFGRIRSLNKAALESFFATRETRNAVGISLISEVATAWLNVAADQDSLRLTQATYAARKDAYDIAAGRARFGSLSDLDLAQAKTDMETSRAAVASAQTSLDQDKAALTLLVGATVPDDLLPQGLKAGQVADSLPVGLPSDVLLARPDVLAAEHDLKAANADIGAARAAFFPTISLTGSSGSASHDLDGLFKSGTGNYSYGVNVRVPIFAGGANAAGLKGAKTSRDIALAQYEHSIQQAFSEVSQALAVRARIDERLDAQTQATDAARTAMKLSQARYDNGTDSYLTLLTTQRTLYASEQSLIDLQTLRATNLVALYRALGNDDSLK